MKSLEEELAHAKKAPPSAELDRKIEDLFAPTPSRRPGYFAMAACVIAFVIAMTMAYWPEPEIVTVPVAKRVKTIYVVDDTSGALDRVLDQSTTATQPRPHTTIVIYNHTQRATEQTEIES